MRTTLLILVFVLVSVLTFAGKTITGMSNSVLDEYRITPVGENMYQLSYSNGEATFTIEVCHDKNECCYLLRGDAVEVMYVCNEFGFGMRKMPNRLKKLETAVYKNLIDPVTFSQQSQLTEKQKDETDALALIACFFPMAIKAESYGLVFNYSKNSEKERLSLKE
jgi:hypothetical protein